MKSSYSRYFFLPENLSSILDFTLVSDKEVRSILFTLGFIKYFQDIHYGSNQGFEFTQLNSQLVAKCLACRLYKSGIQLLLDYNLLVCDNHYIKGVKCKGYQLTAFAKSLKWSYCNFLEVFESIRPSKVTVGYCPPRVDPWAKFCGYLTDWRELEPGSLRDYCENVDSYLQKVTLEAPEEELNQVLDQAADKSFKKYCKKVEEKNAEIEKKNFFRIQKGKAPLPLKEILSSKEEIEQSYREAIRAINEKNFFIKVSDKSSHFGIGSGRICTNITTLPSKLRKYLKYDGHKLVNIDIKCCQAMLLSTFYGDSAAQQTEKAKFVKFFEGDFYADIAQKSGSNMNRDAAKVESFTLFFAKNYTASKTKFTKAFKKEFPLLYANIRTLKKENYRYVAHLLQSAEADIVIKGVSTDLFAKGIANFTIHDSVMATEEHAELVAKALHDKFFEITGVAPTLKIEDYK